MLVLGRKIGEKIIIQTADGQIVIQPVRVHGDIIHIGIDAPRTVPILREELLNDPVPRCYYEPRDDDVLW